MADFDVHHAGSRTDPESSFVKTLRRPEPASRTGSSPLRSRTLSAVGPDVNTKRVLRARRVRGGAARRSSGSPSAASGSTACGSAPSPSTKRSWRAHERSPPTPATSTPTTSSPSPCCGLVHGELEVVRTRDDAALARRRPRRHRRALERGHRRLRPPPARRRGRARQRHPLRQLRPRVARVRRGAGGLARTRRTRSTSASCRASTPTTPARTSPPRWSRASGR